MAWHSGYSVGQPTCVLSSIAAVMRQRGNRLWGRTAWLFESRRACSRQPMTRKEQLLSGSSDPCVCTISTFHINMATCLLNLLLVLCYVRRVKPSRGRANVARWHPTTPLTLASRDRPEHLHVYFGRQEGWSATPATFRSLLSGLSLKLNHTKTSPLRVAAFIMDPTEAVVSDEEHLQ